MVVLFLKRVLLLKPDLLKDFKRVNVPCLPQVSSVFCSIPLNSFCSFQSTFSFTFLPRSVFKINSLTHSLRTVNTSRKLFASVIAQFQPSVPYVMHRCTAASTNGKSRNSSNQPVVQKSSVQKYCSSKFFSKTAWAQSPSASFPHP